MAKVSIGDKLGNFEVLEEIGAGGMGVVYRARDSRLERDVALKVLSPGAISDNEARKRFRNEAIALSRLNHPNIETVYDFGTQDDVDFLVIELIPGVSLDMKLVQGPLSQKEILLLAPQLARGLAAAHEQGILHRDLKPGNLRITPGLHLKILDFGLAKFFHTNIPPAEAETTTKTQGVAGTLPYMAPEQLRGEVADVRSDIYAAGAVLYEMSTGQRPFPESGALLVDAILNRDPTSPSAWNRKLPPALENIICKALDKRPEYRYQSAKELLVDLERFSSVQSAPAARNFAAPPKPSINWKVWLSIAVLVVAAAVLALLLRSRPLWLVGSEVPKEKYLAVLPFRSDNKEDQAFSQGIAETLSIKLMQLTAAHPLQMVSAEEVHAAHPITIEDAKKELGVNLVLEGSLQRLGETLRVNLVLVDVNSHRQLRADSVTSNSSDPFQLENEVVKAATRMLEIELHENEKGTPGSQGTMNKEAYDLYIRGLGYLQNFENPEDVDSAISQFLSALKLDSAYAQAYAGLGQAYWAKYRLTKDTQWVPRVREACERAVAINPRLPEGNLCLGVFYKGTGRFELAASQFQLALNSDPTNHMAYAELASAYERMGSTQQAEVTYKKAIDLRPQYARGYVLLGEFYSHEARYKDSVEQYKKAIALSPNNARLWFWLGGVYLHSGQYEEALKALQRGIEIRPSFDGYSNLGQTYFLLRKFPDAIAAFEQSVALGPRQIQAYGNLARAYYWYPPKRNLARATFLRAIELCNEDLKVNPQDSDAHTLAAEYFAMLGDKAEALRHLNAALRLAPRDAETLYAAALVHNQIGNRNEALFWLEKAVSRGYSPAEVAATIELDSLRDDPRFKSIASAKSSATTHAP